MCKNNFTNENEFDFWVWTPMSDSVSYEFVGVMKPHKVLIDLNNF